MVLLKNITRKLHILMISAALVFSTAACTACSANLSDSKATDINETGSGPNGSGSTRSSVAGSSVAGADGSDVEYSLMLADESTVSEESTDNKEKLADSAEDADEKAADESSEKKTVKINYKKTYTKKQLIKMGYPKSLARLYVRNEEARRFVLDYLTDDIHSYDYENVQNDEVTKGTIPHFLQWDSRWGYEMYGDDFMAVNGCGPTALSMVYCGLTGDNSMNPYILAKYAEEHGYYVDGQGTSWSMMDKMAKKIGLTVHTVNFDADSIKKELKKGRPIIAIMGPGDFTDNGHFIVLTKVTKNGKIRICDPFSNVNTKKAWDIDTLMYQMESLWSYSYK